MKRAVYAIVISLFITGCGYDNFPAPVPPKHLNEQPNADISTIRQFYQGSPVSVNADIVLGGWVVANDRAGNFYRSFVIEDDTGAIEIKAALFELHNKFPVGQYVVVYARGMTLGSDNGVLQLGLGKQGQGTTSPDYIYFPSLLSRYVKSDNVNAPRTPTVVATDNILERHYGSLVRIDGLALKEGEPTVWTDTDGYSSYNYRIFEDDVGEVAVLVSSYADFADGAIPAGSVSITGIAMYGKANGRNMQILKIRDKTDVQSP